MLIALQYDDCDQETRVSESMRRLTGYIGRELGLSFVAVLAVLLLVIMGGEVARLLTEALDGKVSADLVWRLVALKMPVAMEILLPLSVLLAVMLTFGRLYHEREMDVLYASGVGPGYFVRLVLLFGLLLGGLASGLALVGAPWAMQQERALLAEGQLQVQVKALSAGRFMPLPASRGVFYAEQIARDGQMEGVFIQLRPEGRSDVLLTAPRGMLALEEGRTVLRLFDGQMTEGAVSQGRLSEHRFARLAVWLPDWQVKVSALEFAAQNSSDLWQQREDVRAMAQLQWRWFAGLNVLLMALAGWQLARVGPRQGRYARMAWGLGFYLVFTQVAIALRGQVQAGAWPVLPGLWVLVLLPVLLWLPWRRWWARVLA